jgi:hypothetical protein
MSRPDTSTLPIRTGLAFTSAGSFAIAVLMALALVVGLLRSAIIYPSPDLLRSPLPTDAVNLLGLPVLLGSVWSARLSSLVGLLLWPDALLYLLYHDLAYVFSLQLNVLYLLHLALAALLTGGRVAQAFDLVTSADGCPVLRVLCEGREPETLARWTGQAAGTRNE